jgi:hypothetical protein
MMDLTVDEKNSKDPVTSLVCLGFVTDSYVKKIWGG